ncbi:hypothetical protein IAE22_35045, partial [Bacillus sp. S34]|nr:hypothetical protein [Bacillus sp. S34]
EQYWVLSDEYNDVLATTTQEARDFDAWNRPVTAPAIWTRQWGEGRVFVSAPGHRLEVVEFLKAVRGEPSRSPGFEDGRAALVLA